MESDQDGGAPRENASHDLEKGTEGGGKRTVAKEGSQGTRVPRHKGEACGTAARAEKATYVGSSHMEDNTQEGHCGYISISLFPFHVQRVSTCL